MESMRRLVLPDNSYNNKNCQVRVRSFVGSGEAGVIVSPSVRGDGLGAS